MSTSNGAPKTTPAQKPRASVGYDLGHGETSLAWMPMEYDDPYSGRWPESVLLDGDNPSWITAYCMNPDGSPGAIGSTALNMYKQKRETPFHLAFKARPDRYPEAAEHMRRYSQTVWHSFQHQRERALPHVVAVGCPTKWDEQSREAYSRLLRGLHPNAMDVEVIRESRAAMYQALAEHKLVLTKDSFFRDTLVIDVGSSTTDFTAISGPEDDPLDDGVDLGAGLIDELILSQLPGWQKDAALQAAVGEAIVRDRTLLLAECRRAKESYFTSLWPEARHWVPITAAEEARIGGGEPTMTRIPDGDGGVFKFIILLEYTHIREVLETPIEKLGGKSWPQSFTDELTAVRGKLEAKKFKVDKIVLTGGGARMSFVQRIAREIFPHATFVSSSNPSTFISKGLARSCDRGYKGDSFKHETQTALDDELQKIIDTRFGSYKEALAKDFAASIFEKVILPELNDWKAGRNTTIEQTESFIKSRLAKWLGGTEPSQIWTVRTRDLLSAVKRDWCDLAQVKRACEMFGIQPTEFASAVAMRNTTLPPETMPTSLTESGVVVPDFSSAFALLVGALATIMAGIVAVKAIFFPPLLILAAAIAAGGADHVLRTTDLFLWLRDLMLSEEKIRELRTQIIPKLAQQVQQGIGSGIEPLRQHSEASIRSTVNDVVDRELKFIR